MARKARHSDHGSLLSITQRSEVGLFRDNADREMMLMILQKVQAKFAYECYAYCLLDDKIFRLILDTKGRNISSIMSSILVAYSNYRGAEGKLFTGRFVSKSLHNEQELLLEIETIHNKTNSQFNSYCFHCQEAKRPEQFKISIDATTIVFGEIDTTLSLEEAQGKLSLWMRAKGCDRTKLMNDKTLRNQCIAEFRKTTNCSLKTIGLLFDISESSVSKIIK
jgi:hypothetical protein